MILYNFIKFFFLNLKYTRLLNKIYKNENILNNLSQLFEVRFKKDWIGRVYAVLNPNIIKQKYNSDTQIFEYNEHGLDNSIYIEKWIMEKLNIAAQFIKANNLFDLLTYNIKKIDNYDNYLFVMHPITLGDCIKWTKRFSILLLVLIVILIVLLTI